MLPVRRADLLNMDAAPTELIAKNALCTYENLAPTEPVSVWWTSLKAK